MASDAGGEGPADAGEATDSTAASQAERQRLRNKKKKQRSKLAQQVKRGLLPAKGKLAEAASEGDATTGRATAEGGPPAVAADKGEIQNGALNLEEGHKATKRRPERGQGARTHKRAKDGRQAAGRERWPSSQVLLPEAVEDERPAEVSGRESAEAEPSGRKSNTALMIPPTLRRRQLQQPAVTPGPSSRPTARERPADIAAATSAAEALETSAGPAAGEAGARAEPGGSSPSAGPAAEAKSGAGESLNKKGTGAGAAAGAGAGDAARKRGRQGKPTFIYGNYSRYYGYRTFNAFDQDPRLAAMRPEWFAQKRYVDVGCHEGVITIAIASQFRTQSALGIDIDPTLIGNANHSLKIIKDKATQRLMIGPKPDGHAPTDVRQENGRDAAAQLSSLQGTKFTCAPIQEHPLSPDSVDVITMFSVAKWIHLHVGDDGMKLVFRKLADALSCSGILVMEPQPQKSYRQAFRKQLMPPSTQDNYKQMKFGPEKFPEFLTKECGLTLIKQPKIGETSEGFNRPIFVFKKKLQIAQST